jgi:hypothetical protein
MYILNCANVNCVNLQLCSCHARAGPGSFMGRAFWASPARMGLFSAVLGWRRQPVGRPGPVICSGSNGPGWNGLRLGQAVPLIWTSIFLTIDGQTGPPVLARH